MIGRQDNCTNKRESFSLQSQPRHISHQHREQSLILHHELYSQCVPFTHSRFWNASLLPQQKVPLHNTSLKLPLTITNFCVDVANWQPWWIGSKLSKWEWSALVSFSTLLEESASHRKWQIKNGRSWYKWQKGDQVWTGKHMEHKVPHEALQNIEA